MEKQGPQNKPLGKKTHRHFTDHIERVISIIVSLLHKEVVKAFSRSDHAVVTTAKAHAISRLTFPVGSCMQNFQILGRGAIDSSSVFCV